MRKASGQMMDGGTGFREKPACFHLNICSLDFYADTTRFQLLIFKLLIWVEGRNLAKSNQLGCAVRLHIAADVILSDRSFGIFTPLATIGTTDSRCRNQNAFCWRESQVYHGLGSIWKNVKVAG